MYSYYTIHLLNALSGTSEGESVLSQLTSEVRSNLFGSPQDAGEFICYLIDGNVDGTSSSCHGSAQTNAFLGAASFVGATITNELEDDWTALTTFCTSLPRIIEADLEAIVDGSSDAVDIVESFFQDPEAEWAKATSVVGSAWAVATSEIACLFEECAGTAGVWQQLTSSCVSILADATAAVVVNTSAGGYATSTYATSTPAAAITYATSTPAPAATSTFDYGYTTSTSTYDYGYTTPTSATVAAQQTQPVVSYTSDGASMNLSVEGSALLALAIAIGALCCL
jgi:hypothetical protein